MPPAMDQNVVLDAVKHLYALGAGSTAADVAEVIARVYGHPVDLALVRVVLEDLAEKRELGRIHTAPHERGKEPDWTISYFPTHPA
jgi:hypothetical protein